MFRFISFYIYRRKKTKKKCVVVKRYGSNVCRCTKIGKIPLVSDIFRILTHYALKEQTSIHHVPPQKKKKKEKYIFFFTRYDLMIKQNQYFEHTWKTKKILEYLNWEEKKNKV